MRSRLSTDTLWQDVKALRRRVSSIASAIGITELTGDVVAGPGSGSQPATIANEAVTNEKLANMAEATIKGRATGAGTGDPEDLTPDEVSTILDDATDPFLRTSDAGAVGGGNVTSTGAAGSEPGSPVAGDLYVPNNGAVVERYSGSAWVPWGPLFPFTAPVNGDYAWVNQGSGGTAASVDTTHGGIILTRPSTGAESISARVKSAPSTPYTITTAFIPSMFPSTNNNQFVGIGWRNSSDFKLQLFALTQASKVAVYNYSDSTTYASNQVNPFAQFLLPHVWFFRITDDGSDRKCYLSYDGITFILVASFARTTYLTPDQVLFFVNASSGTSENATINLLSWKEA